jgi:hypothetical protein
MIPGVTAQRPGQRFQAVKVLAFQSPSSIGVSRGRSYGKAIAALTGTAVAVGRSKALPKAIAARVGQAFAFAPHLNKILIPQIGQAISYSRRLGLSVRLSQAQRVFAPQVQPGNLRATQVTLQVLETTADPTNLRATQVTLQVLRTQA